MATEIAVVDDVGAVAQALAQMFKLGDAIFETLNSGPMLAARQRSDIQEALAKMDTDLATAQKTGDISTIDKEASG